MSEQQVGKIVQIIGPVIDVEFEAGRLPEIYNALHVVADGIDVIAEVEQHLGENRVRAVAMKPTDGMQRGMKAVDLGEPITVPVGPETLGRVLNVLGEPVDFPDRPVKSKERWSIHRPPPSLEDQSQHPFVNPVEMGLKDHRPILKIVRSDPAYAKAFEQVFGKKGAAITMKEVEQAIAAFERTHVAGDSPFDRYYFKGDAKALTDQQKRGFDLFVNKGRCVSCHKPVCGELRGSLGDCAVNTAWSRSQLARSYT